MLRAQPNSDSKRDGNDSKKENYTKKSDLMPTEDSILWFDYDPEKDNEQTQEREVSRRLFLTGLHHWGDKTGIAKINTRHSDEAIDPFDFPEADLAVEFFKQAAKKSAYANAINNLGIAHQLGLGTVKNLKDARFCFELAAQSQHPIILTNLGLCFLNGIGVTINHAKAYEYFLKAVKKAKADGVECREALFNLGNCHLNGYGTIIDLEAASRYFNAAANLGYAMAQHSVGRYQEAAAQGYAPSQHILGESAVVNQQWETAKKWLYEAAKQKYKPSLSLLNEHFPDLYTKLLDTFNTHKKILAARPLSIQHREFTLTTEKAKAERLAAQKAQAEADRLAAEKAQAEAERLAAEKAQAEAERLAAEKAQAEAQRLAAEKAQAEAERLAAEKAQAEARRSAAAAVANPPNKLASVAALSILSPVEEESIKVIEPIYLRDLLEALDKLIEENTGNCCSYIFNKNRKKFRTVANKFAQLCKDNSLDIGFTADEVLLLNNNPKLQEVINKYQLILPIAIVNLLNEKSQHKQSPKQ